MKIKKGDVVARNSYGKDILFTVERVIKTKTNAQSAILKGLIIRIEADAPVEDLEVVQEELVESNIRNLEDKLSQRVIECKRSMNSCCRGLPGSNKRSVVYTGRILHLDGDRYYAEKSARHYKELGLTAIVKNIPEYKQPTVVRQLLERYKPDILVITRS